MNKWPILLTVLLITNTSLVWSADFVIKPVNLRDPPTFQQNSEYVSEAEHITMTGKVVVYLTTPDQIFTDSEWTEPTNAFFMTRNKRGQLVTSRYIQPKKVFPRKLTVKLSLFEESESSFPPLLTSIFPSPLGDETREYDGFSINSRSPNSPSLWNTILEDHRNYYSKELLIPMSLGFGVGAIMANTSIDESIQKNFHGRSNNNWVDSLRSVKEFGNGYYTVPLFAIAWASGKLFQDSPIVQPVSEWGERSLRTIVVGFPSMLVMQKVTGASRPGEPSSTSQWQPFQDNNGVSGHSFMGAVPFISAAKMTDNTFLKVLFYSSSALVPLSRVSDNDHYSSQALLGWWMAYMAASAVDTTEKSFSNWQFVPMPYADISGIAIERRW